MDLRGILNTADNGGRPPAPPPVTTPKQPQQPPRAHQPPMPPHPQYQPQLAQSPSTPSQAKPSYFPEYAHPTQPSPSRGPHPDYPHHPQRQQSMPYPVQSPYQSPAPYPPRPGPPSIQGPTYPDPRSPATAPRPPPNFARASTTPLPVAPGAPGGGYFSGVHTPTEIASPIQQHLQYPPPNIHPSAREGYGSQSQQGGPLGPGGPYMQSPVVQTPSTPGAPGGPNPYHQRSQSIHSLTSSTPTSAQSQHAPFGSSAFHHQAQQQQPVQLQRSPVATGRPSLSFNRQLSQPPVVQVPASARQSLDISAGFTHPSSPHSQRMPSVGPTIPQQPPQPQSQPQPQLQSQPQLHSQQQPPPRESPSIPGSMTGMLSRISSTHTSPIQHHAELRASQPGSDREHSISVSPKTHAPSLPSDPPTRTMPSAVESQRLATPTPMQTDRAMTPAKRKMDDRDIDEDANRREVRRRQSGSVNGRAEPTTPHQTAARPDLGGSRASVSPVVEKRKPKPKRYAEPPPWAVFTTKATKLKHPNFELPRKKTHASASNLIASPVNGRAPVAKQQSRNASPEAARVQVPPAGPPAPVPAAAAPPPPPPAAVAASTLIDPNAEIKAILGPWEPTIANLKPLDEINKAVADFLFLNVINNPDSSEIASLGIDFEIEAKLGTLRDKDTNQRVSLMAATECVLEDRGRLGFKSSMTEAQHKGLNNYLNNMVLQTDPRNPEASHRAQVHYKHRREVDKWFEMSPSQRELLPPCVRTLMRARQPPRARVTYDQRTNEVLAKIVKVRVADMHIHMPNSPLDCRISINLEMDWPGSVEELEQGSGGGGGRQKDRLSYAQGSIQVDLTQVTTSAPGAPPHSKDHELEVELSPGIVVEQGRRLMNHEPHKYPELVESFVDNVRLLARKVKEFR